MTTVHLHGALAQAVGGSVWRFEVNSLVEIFRALEANTGKAIEYLMTNLDTPFRFRIDDQDLIHKDELVLRQSPKTVHIMPVLQGSGSSGSWLALIGLAIIGAVLFAPVATGAAALAAGKSAVAGYTAFTVAGTSLTTLGTIGLTLGATLTLAGISQLVYGTPSVDGGSESPENKPSYLFAGAVNTYRQGNPIAWGSGLLLVGSQVISAGVRAIDISQDYTPAA